ncbi:LIM and cysteine-rich domains protein 1 isoform X2 [Phycodurus eques]|uniref:LIM and cysteine-rich domains protein 1 isoform X2 n=1 Tax=Phycodurus eques TaxID=693459 RepID=UPI002ACDBD72|nr:LIM and cysteine-rich domains protein 1 isoform X2 [Phycodurus eques]
MDAAEKMSAEASASDPAVCLVCKDGCPGLQPHSWRKACVACGCSTAEHAPGNHGDDDRRMGRLLADSPCARLTAKVKGGGGLRLYKRNRMIVTDPVVSRKDPTFSTTTYDWAPAGLNQKLAKQYMELIPESQRPVSGTGGAALRRRRLLGQLPAYDQDPVTCQSLANDDEVSAMLLFVKRYKMEALGVGEVALPGDGEALREAADQREAREQNHGDEEAADRHPDRDAVAAEESTNGAENNTRYRCSGCGGDVAAESPAVFAERAGYRAALWHPACFACAECGQGLADLVYFWSNRRLLCGRHYCQSVRPRCAGCDELIFGESFRTAQDGRTWHRRHYCCWRCGRSLDTPCHH